MYMFVPQMRVNYSSVQKALRAFDSAGSGVIFPEDLKSVLSSFIFPMNERLFHGLISRYSNINILKKNTKHWLH